MFLFYYRFLIFLTKQAKNYFVSRLQKKYFENTQIFNYKNVKIFLFFKIFDIFYYKTFSRLILVS